MSIVEGAVTNPPALHHDEYSASTSLTFGAYVYIRRKILELEFLPGQRFTEGSLVGELGMSKTPVREALVRLSNEGFVESFDRAGYQVTQISVRDARELIAVLSLVEAKVAEDVAHAFLDVSQLSQLSDGCAELLSGNALPEVVTWVKADQAFHLAMASMASNRRLSQLAVSLRVEFERVQRLSLENCENLRGIVYDHGLLVNAVRCGDVDAAADSSRAELKIASPLILSELASRFEPT